MLAELFEVGLAALRLAALFVTALFLPVMLQLLLLFAAAWAFRGLVGRVSSGLATLLDLIGVPVHELSHALACLVTFCGVAAIKPLIDELGYAFVQPRRWNILGRVAASVAPLFGGMLVLWLTARYVVPGLEVASAALPQLDLTSAASIHTVLRESMDFVERFLQAVYANLPSLEWGNWRTYVGLYIVFSVGIGIAPSSADLKILLASLPLAAVLLLGLFTLLYLAGDVEARFVALQQGLWPLLLELSKAIACAFLVTSIGALLFLPLGWLARRRHGLQ